MRDKKLVALIVLGSVLYAGHTADHIARGDVRWEIGWELFVFTLITLVTYGVVAAGLYLYSKEKVGPRFWAILGGIAVGFGWFAHFSPFTDQPPRYILAAYESAAAGWLAVSDLVALMLVLIVTALYSGYLWMRHAEMG